LFAGAATALWLDHALPKATGIGVVWRWAFILVATVIAVRLVDRAARRLLPLAVLFKLSMIFPDRAPSRFAMARRAGNVRLLHERVRQAREHGVEDDPARAAETILSLVAALSAHDRATRGHSERVRALTDMLGDSLKLPLEDRDRLRWAALLHDIGKLQVSGAILNKPGKPEPHEWDILKQHPEEGARLAAPLLAWLGRWGPAIEQHHERYDGRGYPNGLSGAEISIGGRVVCVTDSFETMTAARPYKKPMSASAAREELARCAGEQFDPNVVRSFLNISLGRLRWTLGPAAWVAQIPFIGELHRAGWQAATATSSAASALSKALVGVIALAMGGSISLPTHRVERPVPLVGPSMPQQAQGAQVAPSDPRNEFPRPGDGSNGAPSDPAGEDDEGPEEPGGPEPEEPGEGEGDIIDDVEDVLEDPVDAVEDILEDPVDAVEDILDDPVDAVDDIVDPLEDVLEGAVDDLGDVVGGLLP
jgi:putative nucleotidyltransferase with HDIG domain